MYNLFKQYINIYYTKCLLVYVFNPINIVNNYKYFIYFYIIEYLEENNYV